MANGQIGAAVTAIKEKGILSGKRIERAEIGAPGKFETMIDEELELALIERIARLLTDPGKKHRRQRGAILVLCSIDAVPPP